MGTHLRVLIEWIPMKTNITGFRWFIKIFASLEESSLSIERVINPNGISPAYYPLIFKPLRALVYFLSIFTAAISSGLSAILESCFNFAQQIIIYVPNTYRFVLKYHE